MNNRFRHSRLNCLLAALTCLAGVGSAILAARAQPPADQSSSTPTAPHQPTLILIVGAPGEKEFEDLFKEWAQGWTEAARLGQAQLISIGRDSEPAVEDRERLRQILAAQPTQSPHPLWIVLVGHGTFNNQTGKFNLRGPDLAAQELADWLKPFSRPLAILNTASASGAFLKPLAGPNRVVLTSTRNGHEQNFARFGQYLAQAIADPAADLDKDNQTSLLEAYLHASRQVAEFYNSDGRLATEHPLLDDNGDGLGTPPDWYRGIRVVKKAKEGRLHDGLRAHQLHLVPSKEEQKMPPELKAKRDQLELEIARLRDQKTNLEEAEYYRALETLLIAMAGLYHTPESP